MKSEPKKAKTTIKMDVIAMSRNARIPRRSLVSIMVFAEMLVNITPSTSSEPGMEIGVVISMK